MSNNTKGKGGKKDWSMALGLYPGILFGIRTYEEGDSIVYVLYMPFVDLALKIYY